MRIVGFWGDTYGCCGVHQVAGFTEPAYEDNGGDIRGDGKDEASACKAFFDNMLLNVTTGYVYQIWFAKFTDYSGEYTETYEREPLRQLVAAIPGVLDLGEYRNPNTGNMIQGYQWRAE